MKYAFIIMDNFNPKQDRAYIHNDNAQIIGVSNIDEACNVAKGLLKDNIDCIELCGAFGSDGAKKIIDATNNSIPIGYVTHLKEQDELFNKTFAEKH